MHKRNIRVETSKTYIIRHKKPAIEDKVSEVQDFDTIEKKICETGQNQPLQREALIKFS